MADTVIITGSDIEVDHQTEGQPDPKRRRPKAYNPPAVQGRDLKTFIGADNPHWTTEANEAAENSDRKRNHLAKDWRHHRIEK